MSYTLHVLGEATRDLVVEALRAEADKRTRVARGAAMHVAADKLVGGKDVRAASVRVAMLLAEAGQLADLADDLAAAADVPVVGKIPPLAVTDPTAAVKLTDLDNVGDPFTPGDLGQIDPATATDAELAQLDDDGLSAAAHALAALAGLDDAMLDEDDPSLDTNATAEDDVDPATVDPAVNPTRAAIAEADAAIIDKALG